MSEPAGRPPMPSTEEMRAAEAAATPRPWFDTAELDDYWDPREIVALTGPPPAYRNSEESSEEIARWCDEHERGVVAEFGNWTSIPDEEHAANKRLVALMREHFVELLDRVEELERQVTDREVLKQVLDRRDWEVHVLRAQIADFERLVELAVRAVPAGHHAPAEVLRSLDRLQKKHLRPHRDALAASRRWPPELFRLDLAGQLPSCFRDPAWIAEVTDSPDGLIPQEVIEAHLPPATRTPAGGG